MSIGKVIRQRRESIGLSLRALAQEIRVNPSYLSRVESGQAPPSDELISKLVHRFQCSEEEFLLLAGKLPRTIKAKVLSCPPCAQPVDLFSNYIFARHADVKKNPGVHVICPDCGEVFASHYDARNITYRGCKSRFDPHCGTAKRTTTVCNHCGHAFPVAKTARARGVSPEHCLYA